MLGKGEIFGHFDAFNGKKLRSMDVVCASQKGEVYSITVKNLRNRCEILSEEMLLSTLKEHALAME